MYDLEDLLQRKVDVVREASRIRRKSEEKGKPIHFLVFWDGSMSMSKTKAVRRSPSHKDVSFSPKTACGRRLLALREKIIAAGIPLLSQEEIEEEVRERKGKDE